MALKEQLLESTASDNRITPSVITVPKEDVSRSTFSTIRQGTATNALTKLPTARNKATIDLFTGAGTITQDNFSLTFPDFQNIPGFKISTLLLFDALTVALTESGGNSPYVSLSLEEYMRKRGLKDKKEARKQAVDDLETLYNATISFKEKRRRGQEQDYHDIRIIDSQGIKKGFINVSFATTFYNILLNYSVMPYPSQLWKINSKRNPTSYYLLRKISEHKYMNAGKKNEDIIAVKTLLAIAANLPAYEEVMKTDKAVTRRIIDPFQRDMDALEETLTWTYCHSNNTPLTDEELNTMDYNVFKSLLVKIDWKIYPDQTARLERKNTKKKKAPAKNRN